MCRFTAYLGPEIAIEKLVVEPAHSLLDQSQNATEAKLAVNGDGFGLAWYNDERELGQYRDILPAWSDGNLTSLCKMISSDLFLAHVRASTIGETARVNCHPFIFENWSFMHNGQIGDFLVIRRKLEALLPDWIYNLRRGSTDSELFFLLMLANGLRDDPYAAVRTTISQIEGLQGVTSTPNRLSIAFSDGEHLYAFRQSSDAKSPTLYLGYGRSGGQVLASEPLDGDAKGWTLLDDGALIKLSRTHPAVIESLAA